MSSALALGAVTAVLKELLVNRLAAVPNDFGGNPPDVSVLPPDRVIPPDGATEPDMLNLFLYQVTPNLGWRNVDYPARDSQGDRTRYPPLALDLHYLLSAYSQVPFRAEIMLGYSMQLLHELGVLSRELISARLADLVDPPENVLRNVPLATQIEMLKITPESLSTEEISKLWAAFQTNYRPTVAYHVSVVLIESDRPGRSALPVRERRVFVMPFQRPVIHAVQPQIVGSGDTLTIQGHNLKATDVRIRFDNNAPIDLVSGSVTNAEISIVIPADLQAGVKTVRVVHYVNYEPDANNSPDLREGFESNPIAFILRPQITTAPPISVAQGATLTLSVAPPVSQRQRVSLLLGEQTIAANSLSLGATPTSTLTFDIPPNFPADTYLARLRVDGAESELQPETGLYNNPAITVTA
jgi:hypothetical protein